jgi:hypothetical protein
MTVNAVLFPLTNTPALSHFLKKNQMRRFRSNTTQLNTNLTKKMKRGIIEFIQNWKIRVRNFQVGNAHSEAE